MFLINSYDCTLNILIIHFHHECENVLGSIPHDEHEGADEIYDFDMPVVRCPECNNLIGLDELIEGQYCPVCFEDLEKEFLAVNEEEVEDED